MSEIDKIERPVLFKGELVLRILAGTKTTTRRPVKGMRENSDVTHFKNVGTDVQTGRSCWESHGRHGPVYAFEGPPGCQHPYAYTAAPGDRLWVRETWYCDDFRHSKEPSPPELIPAFRDALEYRATHDCAAWEAGCPCNDPDYGTSHWKPSIHMPRWASRINLEVTGVRVERIQDASNGDLVHEGWPDADDVALAYASVCKTMHGNIDDAVVEWFADSWDSIYKKQGFGWDANPWVSVTDFRMVGQ